MVACSEMAKQSMTCHRSTQVFGQRWGFLKNTKQSVLAGKKGENMWKMREKRKRGKMWRRNKEIGGETVYTNALLKISQTPT